MATLTKEDLTKHLRETNAQLQVYFDVLKPATNHVPASPQLIANLLSELRVTGQRLRMLPAEKTADLQDALAEYRTNVEHLREMLPLIHAALLAERARLEQERARLDSAAEWVRRSRQTF